MGRLIEGLQAARLLPAGAMMIPIGVVLARSRLWSMRTVEQGGRTTS